LTTCFNAGNDNLKNSGSTPLNDGFQKVSFGDNHITAITRSGTVLTWGDNSKGQCNVPEGLRDVVGVSSGYNHSLALLRDGTVVAWGNNSKGQCDVPEDLKDVVAISAAAGHN
jgi:alpha-tubulin suppressor-like RCC1 family protein